jgi:hypothetical protein
MCLHQSFNPESNPTEVVDFTHHAPQHGSFFQDQGTDAGVVRNLAVLQTSETRLL